jgi:hypothetical protein
MKSNPGFDLDLPIAKRGGSFTILRMGWLIVAVVLCATLAGMGKRAEKVRRYPASVPGVVADGQARPIVAVPPDRFVIEAPAELDRPMVVAAPSGIDEAMVFNPGAGPELFQQVVRQGAGSLVPLPGEQANPLPERLDPPQWYPPAPPR